MFFSILNFIKGLFFFTGSYSVNVFPAPLDKNEELKCIELMKTGDVDARNKLILHNLRLVAHIAKRFEDKNISQDDLISIGTIGLIKGIDSFDDTKNIKITTYAAKCAENEILMYFRANKKFGNDISLNECLGTDKDGNEIMLLDVLPNNDIDIIDKILKNNDVELVNKYMKVLNSREKEIIMKRYGIGNENEYTQKEIANMMNISRSYVSRIEKRALMRLYKEFIKNKKGF